MKKLFVAVALVMGLGTSVTFANHYMSNPIEIVAVSDEYTPIELKAVPQAVQDAVTKNYEGSAIKEAHAKANEDGTKTYKLVLVNGEETEIIVIFNENGEEVKETQE